MGVEDFTKKINISRNYCVPWGISPSEMNNAIEFGGNKQQEKKIAGANRGQNADKTRA